MPEGNRNRQRHENRGTPAPEAEPGDHDDQHNRLPEALHEKVDVLRHLPRLIGGPGQNEVGRQQPLHLFHSFVDQLAEYSDLLSLAHLNRQSDRARRYPASSVRSPRIVIQIRRRALVFALYFANVAEIDRSAARRRSHGDTADFFDRAKLARRDNRDVSSLRVHLAARGRDVSLAQRLHKGGGRKSISGEPVLRIREIHALIQHSHAFYFAH